MGDENGYFLSTTEGAKLFSPRLDNVVPVMLDCFLPEVLRGENQKDHEAVLDPSTEIRWMAVSSYRKFEHACRSLSLKSETDQNVMVVVRPYTSLWNAHCLKELLVYEELPKADDEILSRLRPSVKGKEALPVVRGDWCHGCCEGLSFTLKNPEVLFEKAAKYIELTELCNKLTDLSESPLFLSQHLDQNVSDLETQLAEQRENLALSMWLRGAIDKQDNDWTLGPHDTICKLLPQLHSAIYEGAFDPCSPAEDLNKRRHTAQDLFERMKEMLHSKLCFEEEETIDLHAFELLKLESQHANLLVQIEIDEELAKVKASIEKLASLMTKRCSRIGEETIECCSSLKDPTWLSIEDNLYWKVNDLRPLNDVNSAGSSMEGDSSPNERSPSSSGGSSMEEGSPRQEV